MSGYRFLYWDECTGKVHNYPTDKPNIISDPGDEQESIEDVHKP
jgi:hypothetical protein